MCYVCLCVSHFSPGRGSRRPGFADVGPKVLVRYWYHSYGAQFLCWRLSLGKDSKSPTYSGTILLGEHFCNWLKPPLRITTPTLTLYWVLLEVKS